MTRINYGVPPTQLIDQHLTGELHELPRVFTLVENRVKKGTMGKVKIPDAFTLGTGHVLFFYNKLGYLHDRYLRLLAEYTSRTGRIWNSNLDVLEGRNELLVTYMGKASPTAEDRQIVEERIREMAFKMKREPTYYGLVVPRPLTAKKNG